MDEMDKWNIMQYILMIATSIISGFAIPFTTWIMVGLGWVEPFEFTIRFKRWKK